MDTLVNALTTILVFGLAYAMLLFIISVGLSVTMGLMGFVNLAHGAFAMLGGYVTVTLVVRLGMPFLLALPIAFVAVAAISIVLERMLYACLYKASELDQVLLTIGLVFVSIASVTFIWGPNPISIPTPPILTGDIDLGVKRIPLYRAFMIVSGAIIVAGLYYGLERTRIGAQIRAAVDNRRMAESCGVNTDRLFAYTFALGSGLAALGADLVSRCWGACGRCLRLSIWWCS